MKRVKQELIFSGRLIKLYIEEWTDGEKTYLREVVRHPGAVGVLPLYGENVILVKQFRQAVREYLIEIPAGLIEPEEHPEETARREVEEETGFSVETLKKLAEFYSSPGMADEVLHLYLAKVKPSIPDLRNPDEDETLEVLLIHRNEFLRLADTGQLKDSKTFMAALILKNHLAANETV